MKKILLYLFIALSINNISAQGVSYNEEFQVNVKTDFDQTYPSVSGLINGDFVITWTDIGVDENGEIYAQIFYEGGIKKGYEIHVNTYANSSQERSKVAGLSNGGFVICWESFFQDNNDGAGIYAQIFDDFGNKVGNEFLVNTYIKGHQVKPSLTSLQIGGFVISWESYKQENPDNYNTDLGIYSQVFNETGEKIGQEIHVNTTTFGDQSKPAVENLKNGNCVISWESINWDNYEFSINAQIINKNGQKVGEEFQVNHNLGAFAWKSDIACLSDSTFIICWEKDESHVKIMGQLFEEDGTKIGTSFVINISNISPYNREPVVTNLNNGGFIVSWTRNWDICAQLFDKNNNRIGEEFLINSNTKYKYQEKPTMCNLTNGNFVVCWTSYQQDGFWDGVYAKYFLGNTLNQVLQNFYIISPQNDESISNLNINFQWNHSNDKRINFPWELTYDLYIGSNENFIDPIIITEIEDTTYQISSLTPGNTYFWKVLAKNYYGDSLWSSNVNGFYIDPNATDVKQIDQTRPSEFIFHQNYPNPFNPTTKIRYSIPTVETHGHASVQLKIYDVLGRLVKVLVNETQKPGNYSVEFDGSNLTSGIYYYNVTADEFSVTKKMLLLK